MPRILIAILLFLYGAVAAGIPLSRVVVGSMPLYFVDILAFLVLIAGRNHMRHAWRSNRKISAAIILFIIAIIPTHLSEIYRIGLVEPTYVLIRTMLHVITAWAVAGLVMNDRYFGTLLTGFACGALFTGFIATFNSLPITGTYIRSFFFSKEILFPTGTYFNYDNYLDGHRFAQATAQRGNSLVGKSNPTGMVLVTALPIVLGAYFYFAKRTFIKVLFGVAALLIFTGSVFTYSRAAYVSLALILMAYVYLERRVFANSLLPMIIIGGIGVAAIGVGSNYFKFEFIVDKFDLQNEQYQETNQARILSFIRPWQLVLEDPTYVVRGAGRTDKKLRDDSKKSDASILTLLQGEMHSVPAASVFYRGFLAFLAMHFLYYRLVSVSWKMAKHGRRTQNREKWMPIALLIMLIGLLTPWMTDHYLVTKMSAHMYLFMIIGLLMGMHARYVRSTATSPAEKKTTPTNSVHGSASTIRAH